MDAETKKLLLEGQKCFSKISKDINLIGEKIRPSNEYRRKCDHDEMCIALALLNQKIVQVFLDEWKF